MCGRTSDQAVRLEQTETPVQRSHRPGAGIKSASNETYEPPFRGSVAISQNAVVDASDAVLQRIVHLKFGKSDHSAKGIAAAKALTN